MKKVFANLIICLIVGVICIGFVGCSSWPPLPEGYVTSDKLPVEYSRTFYLFHQFPDTNQIKSLQILKFIYNDELYIVEAKSSKYQYYYNYFVNKDEEKLGDFMKMDESNATSWHYRAIFLDEHYLYYGVMLEIKQEKWAFLESPQIRHGCRYVFYRFDLRSSKNEVIGGDHYLEKLTAIAIES